MLPQPDGSRSNVDTPVGNLESPAPEASLLSTSLSRSQVAKRRSSRIALYAPVALNGEDRAKDSFSLTAKATNLNRHGAAVVVTRELLVGTTVVVRNERGTQIAARVVAQVSATEGKHTYGIEFVEESTRSNSFWGITFPSNA